MQFEELLKISDEALDYCFWDYWAEWSGDEAEYFRLMWNMCYDHHEKALMIDMWKYKSAPNRNVKKNQEHLMNKCHPVVAKYMDDAPTWIDSLIVY